MDDLSDLTNRRQLEFSTQFFGFTPESLVDFLLAEVTDIVSVNLRGVKQHIRGTFSVESVSDSELDESFSRLQDRFCESAESVYFKMGRYLRENLLRVPASVPLFDGFEDVSAEEAVATEADAAEAMDEYQLLCGRVKQAKVRKVLLAAKKASLERLLERQRSMEPRLEKLRKTSLSTPSPDMNLELLQQLLTQVENNLTKPGRSDEKPTQVSDDVTVAKKI